MKTVIMIKVKHRCWQFPTIKVNFHSSVPVISGPLADLGASCVRQSRSFLRRTLHLRGSSSPISSASTDHRVRCRHLPYTFGFRPTAHYKELVPLMVSTILSRRFGPVARPEISAHCLCPNHVAMGYLKPQTWRPRLLSARH